MTQKYHWKNYNDNHKVKKKQDDDKKEQNDNDEKSQIQLNPAIPDPRVAEIRQ